MIKIEKRKYSRDNTSEEEIATLKKRIDYIDDNIILLKEISIPTAFVHQLFFEKLNKIVNSNDNSNAC